MNANRPHFDESSQRLHEALKDPRCYPGKNSGKVTALQTHISHVYLVGDHAYKIKKPIKNDFLDYSTLEKRRHFCEEELRKDKRYADDLYLAVVPISMVDGQVVVESNDDPIEYAVKMRRFPGSALLSHRMDTGRLTTDEVFGLAECVAEFHQSVAVLERVGENQGFGAPASILHDAQDNFPPIESLLADDRFVAETRNQEMGTTAAVLRQWTEAYFREHRRAFQRRRENGFIRECHGDMHLANIVHWNGRLIPFDGIEFNESFRWIDVVSDASFAAMDFAAHGRLDLARAFINAYLEHTGDYESLVVLRWYLVYRAMVRAKVAAITVQAAQAGSELAESAMEDCRQHIELAYRFSLKESPGLWITHGVSGSGKSTVSEIVVQRRGAIRLRSDVERKRAFGLSARQRPNEQQVAELYSDTATEKTYVTLLRLARRILRDGYPVVVDATFLERHHRLRFETLAYREGATFGILDCHTDELTLRQRIADRMSRDQDVSDADLRVLDQQLQTLEPLAEDEAEHVFEIPTVEKIINRL